jgi:hypothetical protein
MAESKRHLPARAWCDMASDELDSLRRASAGLEYPSESDTPFDVFVWKGNGRRVEEVVAEHAGKGRTIEETPLDRFFAQLKDSEDADRFELLRRALESQLSGVRVFRASDGSAKIDVYLVGKTRGGDWAGLHTVSVET